MYTAGGQTLYNSCSVETPGTVDKIWHNSVIQGIVLNVTLPLQLAGWLIFSRLNRTDDVTQFVTEGFGLREFVCTANVQSLKSSRARKANGTHGVTKFVMQG